jgi:oxygen-independent coproporphyrinogen-3 oxidase
VSQTTALSATQESLEVTRELLDRYDRPGPRYTSYPTAPEWSHDFGAVDYGRALDIAAENSAWPLSLYVHLPFCWERCHFCGCNVVISKHPEVSEKYLQYVYQEIAMASKRLGGRKTVKQLHWGGGTPTYQSVEQIKALHGVLTREFDFAPDAEVALEVDPRVTSLEQLQTLRALGFNRISMGVQDLDPTVQATINRNQTEEQTRTLFNRCRDLGFSGINIDLIYGLPDQTPETWAKTIETVIDIRPDRLAVYSYAHLPDQIKHQRKMDERPRPTGAEKYELFAIARRLFVAAGYRIIGMDHFALPTDELAAALNERRLHRNFMGYTVVPAEDMVAFGVSGIGEVGGAYAQNEKRPAMYYKALDEGVFPTLCGAWLTDDDAIRRWTIRQLMCNFYLDFAVLKQRFGVDYDAYFADEESRLQEFYQEQFMVRDAGGLWVLPLGQAFVRNVAMVFDAHLKKPAHFKNFSRTI